MSEEKISIALDALREHGERLAEGESKERLSSLVDRFEQNALAAGLIEDQQDLMGEVQDAITHFEVEHPSITGILHEVMMTLSNMGI